MSSTDHPLLGVSVEDPRTDGLTFTTGLSLDAHPWLADHAIEGRVLLPGAAFLELSLAAAEESGCAGVEELTIQAPLIVPESGEVALRASVAPPDAEGRREIGFYARQEGIGEDAGWTCHAEGVLAAEAPPSLEGLASWPPDGAESIDLGDFYARLAAAGLEYGPVFQGLRGAWQEGEALYAEVALPEEMDSEARRYGLHPALLDAALHASALAAAEDGEGLWLPFSWSGVSLLVPGARRLRVRIIASGEGQIGLTIADGSGAPVARVDSLVVRPLDPRQLRATGADGLYTVRWEPAGPDSAPLPVARVAELSEDPAGGRAIAPLTAALKIIKEHLEAGPDGRLAILTHGAVAAQEAEAPSPSLAAVWGLVRSAQAEHPDRFLLIDSDDSAASRDALPGLLEREVEPQLALREGKLLVPRLVPPGEAGLLQPPPGPWRLEASRRGTLDGLALVPCPSAAEPLGPTQVRLQMRAAGLNFRDVLAAVDLYPGDLQLGGEGAGVVSEVGAEVTDLQPGDRVFGVIEGAFGPFAVAERSALLAIPKDWSFEQAAALPIVFATAHYGLVELARLGAGERVLVHAGAGGVGMAAIGIARHLGADVFATASPDKHAVLRELGLTDDRIASSRDLEFEQRFLAATDGEGVEVVLNSLTGEFVDASLRLLPRGGRFLEMGKSDVRDAERVSRDHAGVEYRAFDLNEAGEDGIAAMLANVVELLERGDLNHSPIQTWDVRRAPDAFRHLREGRNVGKVVLPLPRPLDPDRTVLITGGLGSLGSLVARHLVEGHGVRHLLLAGRSGPATPGAEELKGDLERLGAAVRIVACDVSDREQLETLLAGVPAEHPLGAVVHAAGVVADATIDSLDAEHLVRALGAKAEAARHLHELTADADLCSFVLFSSIAGPLGGPGQGAYAAANAYLDALAQQRVGAGLPATSIAWGLWERESAMKAGMGDTDLARMRSAGIGALTDEDGLALLDAALAGAEPLVLAMQLELPALRTRAAAGMLQPIMSRLAGGGRRRRETAPAQLAATLAPLAPDERERHVLELVRSEVATVLGHASADAIGPRRAFKDLGFDSLGAVELRNRLKAATGLRLPSTVVFDHPCAADLAEHLLSSVSAVTNGSQQGHRIEAALGRFKTAIAEVEPGEQREWVAARLRELLAELAGEPADDGGLETATDEEMFDLLDQKLGRI